MGIQPNQDFASLLDQLVDDVETDSTIEVRANIPFDYLSVVEELHSGRIRVSNDAVTAEYLDVTGDEGVEALFAAAGAMAEELHTDPESIKAELQLSLATSSADLARIRRAFAFRNHPDRMPPHLREIAIQRMQIANMLIDTERKSARFAA